MFCRCVRWLRLGWPARGPWVYQVVGFWAGLQPSLGSSEAERSVILYLLHQVVRADRDGERVQHRRDGLLRGVRVLRAQRVAPPRDHFRFHHVTSSAVSSSSSSRSSGGSLGCAVFGVLMVYIGSIIVHLGPTIIGGDFNYNDLIGNCIFVYGTIKVSKSKMLLGGVSNQSFSCDVLARTVNDVSLLVLDSECMRTFVKRSCSPLDFTTL